jgi:hypothetical protein
MNFRILMSKLLLIVMAIWIINIYPVYAIAINVEIPIEQQTNLSDSQIKYWQTPPEKPLTESELMKLSTRLRDISRFLSTSWPVPIAMNINSEDSILQINDFQKADSSWVPLSAGYSLLFVGQEIETLKTSAPQPLINFLVFTGTDNKSTPLLDVPLSRYCFELFQKLIKK